MEENLVIVESPAKAKTIGRFLGKGYRVESSFGHIRDLSKKNLGIDITANYAPHYEVPPDKKKVVTELKKLAKSAEMVWLASDEDREGEAIAWHLYEELNLDDQKTKRIVFHEITKNAITHAIETPRTIDANLVNAQQARRVLDRLVGFELSPVLWKKVKPSLSAGRVQSVAVRLLVEREREIIAFKSSSSYRVVAAFMIEDAKGQPVEMKAELTERFKTKQEAEVFLERCKEADFQVSKIETKPAKKHPAAPFTTSTLQQEASRKLSFSVSQTMLVAQRLYEAGLITYMRTDSLNLSETAIEGARKEIEHEFGSEYVNIRHFKTKAKGAQEAHEAIRPTYLDRRQAGANAQEKRLYDLIWKRTIASQMSDAKLEKTTVSIDISTSSEHFIAKGEVLKFDGFLKVYIESTDDEPEESTKGLLPPLKKGDLLDLDHIMATERFTHHPPRYTEASLVKKLEELGIGRPSTYAPTISTIQKRNYVVKEDREGRQRFYVNLLLRNKRIKEEKKSEVTGTEKAKLFPTDIGMVVNDFLVENFKEILDYNFTASVEKEFDEIASGKLEWSNMIDKFYAPFHKRVEHTLEHSEHKRGERLLGEDPKTGEPVIVRIGRYGAMAQIGTKNEETGEKPRYAALRKGQHIETISLEAALDLFKLPRKLGIYEDYEVVVGIGRFGPYVRHNGKFFSLKKDLYDPHEIELDAAIQVIEDKREADRKKHIKSFEEHADMAILNGRWGPYISYEKKNYRIPKDVDPKGLSYEDCLKLIEESANKKTTGKGRKKAPAKRKTDSSSTKKTTKRTTGKKTTSSKAGKSGSSRKKPKEE